MTDELENESEEHLNFWRGWKGLYIFILVYATLQIVLLYLFTRAFNQS